MCDAQSIGLPHGLPVAHIGVHAGAWHIPLTHTIEPQSTSAPHGLPSLHSPGIDAHIGAAHAPLTH